MTSPHHDAFTPEVVNLSDALAHPQFDPDLASLVRAQSKGAPPLALADILAILDIDPVALSQSLVANAVAVEFQRCQDFDAKAAGGLH
jgi:hypothetical protein